MRRAAHATGARRPGARRPRARSAGRTPRRHPRPVHDPVGELGGALARARGATRSRSRGAAGTARSDPGRTRRRGRRHCAPRARGDSADRRTRLRARRAPGPQRRHHDRGSCGLHGRRRRRQQPLRPRPGHVPRTHLALRPRPSRDLRIVIPRRGRDRARGRPRGPRRHTDHGLRMDVPALATAPPTSAS